MEYKRVELTKQESKYLGTVMNELVEKGFIKNKKCPRSNNILKGELYENGSAWLYCPTKDCVHTAVRGI